MTDPIDLVSWGGARLEYKYTCTYFPWSCALPICTGYDCWLDSRADLNWLWISNMLPPLCNLVTRRARNGRRPVRLTRGSEVRSARPIADVGCNWVLASQRGQSVGTLA